MDRKTKRVVIIAVAVLAVLVAAFALIYGLSRPSADSGEIKTVALTVDFGDGKTEQLSLKTEGSTLRDALESVEGLVTGDESDYGLFITAVRGVAADTSKQQWWCVSKNGEMLMTGVDDTPISDGESYELTLKTGY